MVKYFLIVAVCFLHLKGNAQIVNYASTGLIRASATFAPAYQFRQQSLVYYINGNADYFFQDWVSLKTDLYFLNSQPNAVVPFQYNNQILFGTALHYNYGHLDSYFSVQTGIAIVKLRDQLSTVYVNTAEPIISTGLGLNFYAAKYFHIYAEANFVHGNYHGLPEGNQPLDEVRIKAGLGFNFAFHHFAYWENHAPKFGN